MNALIEQLTEAFSSRKRSDAEQYWLALGSQDTHPDVLMTLCDKLNTLTYLHTNSPPYRPLILNQLNTRTVRVSLKITSRKLGIQKHQARTFVLQATKSTKHRIMVF